MKSLSFLSPGATFRNKLISHHQAVNKVDSCLLEPARLITSFIHCLMIGDELLRKRSPDQNQILVMINGTYHVKCSSSKDLKKLTILSLFTSIRIKSCL